MDDENNLKIADFGVSQILEDEGTRFKDQQGTTMFLAPEAWNGGNFKGRPLDIWAAGCTLYYLATKKFPFYANERHELMELVNNQEYWTALTLGLIIVSFKMLNWPIL